MLGIAFSSCGYALRMPTLVSHGDGRAAVGEARFRLCPRLARALHHVCHPLRAADKFHRVVPIRGKASSGANVADALEGVTGSGREADVPFGIVMPEDGCGVTLLSRGKRELRSAMPCWRLKAHRTVIPPSTSTVLQPGGPCHRGRGAVAGARDLTPLVQPLIDGDAFLTSGVSASMSAARARRLPVLAISRRVETTSSGHQRRLGMAERTPKQRAR
jgi:hypothetical protein